MGFMQKQVTGLEDWAEVETNCGTEFVPIEQLGIKLTDNLDAESLERARIALRDYVEGSKILDYQIVKGYGARLSAPGYMDCTEWTVFDTELEAYDYLEQTYGDDDE